MKKIILTLNIIAALSSTIYTQVPLKTIVEHFTNTKCSVCASKNPGFYTNLGNHPDVLHLSIHPSAPYATCPLSQQNMTDNDARTNYYGIYGATPRIVINGDVTASSTNYSSSSLFTPYQGLTSSFALTVSTTMVGADSIHSAVMIKKMAASSLTNVSLFIGLVEDTIFLNGGNGETKHFNVLRKAVSGSAGLSVTLPNGINDSMIVSKTSHVNAIWNKNRMYTIAILQDASNKDVIQSEKSSLVDNATSAGIEIVSETKALIVYPNPASHFIYYLLKENTLFQYDIFNINGQQISSGSTSMGMPIDISVLENGVYAILLYGRDKKYKAQIYVQR